MIDYWIAALKRGELISEKDVKKLCMMVRVFQVFIMFDLGVYVTGEKYINGRVQCSRSSCSSDGIYLIFVYYYMHLVCTYFFKSDMR